MRAAEATAADSTPVVVDPFGVAADPSMPYLPRALEPSQARPELERHVTGIPLPTGQLLLRTIRVVRYKPARRCLIEYDLEIEGSGGSRDRLTVLGKVRARGLDRSSHDLLCQLVDAGFGSSSPDGIFVPEPAGVIPDFQMWLQRKVPGHVATRLLARPEGVALAARIAEAAHKLHSTGIAANRRHTIADELRILHGCLGIVAQSKPRWAKRLTRLLDACDRLGDTLPEPKFSGIHRDFYPDQVIVDGPRLYLVDFDLYCEGDPGLDIGNFLGHVTEQSLRTLGDPEALADREKALAGRFAELSGESVSDSVQVYTTLTLVRHIYLSTQFPDRYQTTEALLDLCEQRLAGTEHARPRRRVRSYRSSRSC